ncbi:MAG: septum formation inhibitor Maf [Alcaligenaceae bacterium]|nr:septum formation inhibitor Maf [Alcaligenaceae bacterium]
MPASNLSLLYLASESPRRHELLLQIGVPHTVLRLPVVIGEDEPRQPNETPLAYVQRTALDKTQRAKQWLANNVSDSQTDLPILTADTTVALGDMIFGKPVDAQHAALILGQLSGQTHTVYTAVVLAQQTGLHTCLSTSRVSFKQLSEKEILQYIDTGDCFGKAGAYGIQGFAARFIRELQGSYSGVMGLPLFETTELLRAAKILF